MINFLLHIDQYINTLIYGQTLVAYLILFMIIFVETGLVIMPFLPGDSVLFATGAVIAESGMMNIYTTAIILYLAAILGDSLNYYIGEKLGKQLIKKNIIKKSHVDRTSHFFKKYGTQTITIARFVPIVRTVAPFVAGLGKMPYSKFLIYNIIGGITWVTIMLGTGYYFGNLPFIQQNFGLIIIAVVFISFIPVLIAYLSSMIKKK